MERAIAQFDLVEEGHTNQRVCRSLAAALPSSVGALRRAGGSIHPLPGVWHLDSCQLLLRGSLRGPGLIALLFQLGGAGILSVPFRRGVGAFLGQGVACFGQFGEQSGTFAGQLAAVSFGLLAVFLECISVFALHGFQLFRGCRLRLL